MRAPLGRRLARSAAAGLAASVLAAGCAPGTDATLKPVTVASLSGIGPITFATGGLDTGNYLPTLLRQWNAAHPRQRVTLIPLPYTADDQHAQMVANLQTRSSLYDVMSLDVVWTAEFAANGWIVPLNPRLFPLPDFLPPAVATAQYAGRLFAVPFTSNAGLLYYRSDILAAAHARPPRTWAQLARLAATLGPRNHVGGYGGQLSPYEGLTVNFAEAVQSAGGRILSPDGTTVALDSSQARNALNFLLGGLKAGWIPRAALGWAEAQSATAFLRGKLLFLRNWPYVYGQAAAPGSPVAGKFGVTALPGQDGPGSAVLGGADLAISAYSRHQRTALAFIKFLTSKATEREVLVNGSLPPVWTSLYSNRALDRRFPYLPALRKAILTARPRPQTPSYSQLSLAISGTVHQALVNGLPAGQTIARLARELRSFVRTG
jgi:multiple sugar transport system substrate-binding protein